MAKQHLSISDYDPSWPARFRQIASRLRTELGDEALRIDHIGSTSVPDLAAKDLIDIQVTVRDLAVADRWPTELPLDICGRPENRADHIPPGASAVAGQWEKRYWSSDRGIHVHVRAEGRHNQRYPLLFRDYLRADPLAAAAYGAVKRALAAVAPDDWETYYEVKDPACDLIIAGAEHWAVRTGWTIPPSDA